MIHAFGLLGTAELGAPTAITGGIAEALIATAFGLLIAIDRAAATEATFSIRSSNRRGMKLKPRRRNSSVSSCAEAYPVVRFQGDDQNPQPAQPRMRLGSRSPSALIDVVFFLLATFVMVSSLSMVENWGLP